MRKRCEICNEYLPMGLAQSAKYCPGCREEANRRSVSQYKKDHRALNHRKAQKARRESMKVGHKAVTIIDPLCDRQWEITLSELQQYKHVYLAQGVKILVRGKTKAIQEELWK